MKSDPPQTGRSPWWAVSLFLLIVLSATLIAIPSVAEDRADIPVPVAPGSVQIRVYVVDFNDFNVATGTVNADFYVTLQSDNPVSLEDFEIMNGQIKSVDTIDDSPLEKEYRIVATVTVDPDLRRYPFDLNTIPIIIESKVKNNQELVLVINQTKSGLGPEVDLPGWRFVGSRFITSNQTYTNPGVFYSRAIFNYGIERDVTSTVLKFFLPLMLIIIVSLFSLIMKSSPRLLLNASMFIGTILIHWYLTASIPLVAYATFLDLFMIITYTTLVMVLLSGILIQKYTESEQAARVEQVYRWSIRSIPLASLLLFGVLFFWFFL